MGVTQVFETVILIQMFFSVAITGLAHYMPDDALNYISEYKTFGEKTDLEEIRDDVEDNLEKQTNIPIVELGALVFYSGNILVDLILNFAFAVPEMVTLFINVITSLINVPAEMANMIAMFAGVSVSVLYFISIIQFLVGIRSGRLT